MDINYNTIDSLISNLINFKKRLSIELNEYNKTNSRKSTNSISEILIEIERGISDLPSIRNKSQQNNLSFEEKTIIRHFNTLVNQDYASMLSKANVRVRITTVNSNQKKCV